LVQRIDTVITKVSLVMSRVGGVFLLLAALLVSVEVLGRRFLFLPFSVGTELSTYALAVGASWSFAQALLQRAHVRIDVLRSLLPPRGRTFLDIVALVSLAAW
jgi:TRAP-type C4-dicarboxylate transport system permease small subunit